MTDDSPTSKDAWRIDPPQPARARGLARASAKVRTRRSAGAVSAESRHDRPSAGSPILSTAIDAAGSTLIERLDAHARSLGETLAARQAEIDGREAAVHARLADLEAMRRELELWSDGERSELARRRAQLEERSAQIDVDANVRRQALDRRETVLAESLVAVERTQARLIDLQRRCEETMRRFDFEAGAPAGESRSQGTEPAVAALRVVHGDAGRKSRSTSSATAHPPEARDAPAAVAAEPFRKATESASSPSHELIRLHEALLAKERFLAEEARRFERERKRFAELRMNWITERLQRQDRLQEGEALRELRALRAELEQERLDRVQVQKRRHQRMQHLLEAIEDEIARLDLAWASVPQW